MSRHRIALRDPVQWTNRRCARLGSFRGNDKKGIRMVSQEAVLGQFGQHQMIVEQIATIRFVRLERLSTPVRKTEPRGTIGVGILGIDE